VAMQRLLPPFLVQYTFKTFSISETNVEDYVAVYREMWSFLRCNTPLNLLGSCEFFMALLYVTTNIFTSWGQVIKCLNSYSLWSSYFSRTAFTERLSENIILVDGCFRLQQINIFV